MRLGGLTRKLMLPCQSFSGAPRRRCGFFPSVQFRVRQKPRQQLVVEDRQGGGFGFGIEVGANTLGGGGADYGGEGVGAGLFDSADASEVFEQALAGTGTYAGDGEEFGVAVAHLAALAVVGDGEAVALVADFLDEVQDGGAAVQDYGFVLLSVDVDDLLFFCDGCERLEGDADLFERGVGGVELAKASVDEDE